MAASQAGDDVERAEAGLQIERGRRAERVNR
jgi:hypothetical protein